MFFGSVGDHLTADGRRITLRDAWMSVGLYAALNELALPHLQLIRGTTQPEHRMFEESQRQHHESEVS